MLVAGYFCIRKLFSSLLCHRFVIENSWSCQVLLLNVIRYDQKKFYSRPYFPHLLSQNPSGYSTWCPIPAVSSNYFQNCVWVRYYLLGSFWHFSLWPWVVFRIWLNQPTLSWRLEGNSVGQRSICSCPLPLALCVGWRAGALPCTLVVYLDSQLQVLTRRTLDVA